MATLAPVKSLSDKRDKPAETSDVRKSGIVVKAPAAKKLDKDLVETAATEVKAILQRTFEKGIVEVGEYLFSTFYEGDVGQFHSTSPRKHKSLSALVEKLNDLGVAMSPAQIRKAISIAVRAKELPEAKHYLQLPPSQQIELAPVDDPQKLEALAAEAVKDNLTVRQLRERVRKARGKKKRGAPRKPEVFKTVNRILKELRNEETGRLRFLKDDLESVEEEERAELRKTLERVSDLVEGLVKLVGK